MNYFANSSGKARLSNLCGQLDKNWTVVITRVLVTP